MVRMNMVSIIIPVYNVEAYIEDCVKSVICQTYNNIEVILVDDCGGDESVAKAEKILNESDVAWRCVRHERNRGLSAARNTGVKNALGRYIYFLDSDDYIAPECIDIMVKAAEKYRVPIVIGCGIVLLMPDGSLKPIWKENAINLHEYEPFRALLRLEHSYMACHRLLETEIYRKSGVTFREGIYHEDVIWSYMMAKTGIAICSAEGSNLYYYRQREGSIMSLSHNSSERLFTHMEVMRLFYHDLEDDVWSQDADLRNRYAALFNEAVHRIMIRKDASMRMRCRDISKLLQEFSYVIDENRATYKRMSIFVKLSRYMPSVLAYKLSSLFALS